MISTTWLDVVVWVLIGVFAVAGWGRGLLRTLIWGAGVIAGALVGLVVFPQIVERILNNSLLIAAISFGGVVGGAVIGGVGAGVMSKLIRPVVLPLGFLRLLDHVAGAVIGGVAMAIVVWLIAASVVVSWIDQLASLPNNQVVVLVERYVPSQLREGLIVVIDRFGLPVEIETSPPIEIENAPSETVVDPNEISEPAFEPNQ